MKRLKKGDDEELVKENISPTPPAWFESVTEDRQAGVPSRSQESIPRCWYDSGVDKMSR